MKALIVSFYFPPAGGGGVQRPLKLAQYLPAMGIETHVLAPDDPRWLHRDEGLRMPSQAWVHRARYVGVSGGKPSEVLAGTHGLERALTHARLQLRRLVVPDENATWAVTAIPAGIRLVREHEIDVVVSTSPPPLDASDRRGDRARHRAHAGSPTCATRSSRTRTGGRTRPRRRRRRRCTSASRGSSPAAPTRSRASPRRSARRRGRSSRAAPS